LATDVIGHVLLVDHLEEFKVKEQVVVLHEVVKWLRDLAFCFLEIFRLFGGFCLPLLVAWFKERRDEGMLDIPKNIKDLILCLD